MPKGGATKDNSSSLLYYAMAMGIRRNLENVSWSNENSNSLALELEPGCASWKCESRERELDALELELEH